jgi:hypothetical protein
MDPSHPSLPRSKVPSWERRKAPFRRRWNGRRREDPRLPRWEGLPLTRQTFLYALAGLAIGLIILVLTAP